MPTKDEFSPSRSLDLEARLAHVENWASLFSGRQSVDPSAVESAATAPGAGGSGTSWAGTLMGDVTGFPTANTVERLRNKALTGTEALVAVYAYDGAQWVAQKWVGADFGIGAAAPAATQLAIFAGADGTTALFTQPFSGTAAAPQQVWASFTGVPQTQVAANGRDFVLD